MGWYQRPTGKQVKFTTPLTVEITLSSILTLPRYDEVSTFNGVVNLTCLPVGLDTTNSSLPSSSYSNLTSLSEPNENAVSSVTANSPVPSVANITSPSVFVDDNVLPSILRLSTFH